MTSVMQRFCADLETKTHTMDIDITFEDHSYIFEVSEDRLVTITLRDVNGSLVECDTILFDDLKGLL